MAKLAAALGTIVGPIIPNTTLNLNDTYTTLVNNEFLGMLMVGVPEDNAVGFFAVENGNLSVIYANSLFTLMSAIPNKYYVFFDSNLLKITNKVGDGKTIKMSMIGLEPRTS